MVKSSEGETLMKNILKTLTLALLLAASAFGKDKPVKPVVKKPVVSSYMRDMGLLYLEELDNLQLRCKVSSEDGCLSRWESNMDSLEDRITVTLSESKRPSGDQPYFELLKAARFARKFNVLAEDHFRSPWVQAQVTCTAYAHTVAIEGELYNGDGGCEDAVHKAANPPANEAEAHDQN
jgi:hypothetical protein